ncbi:transporter [Ganoderma sinense ZZ0214-1]|uniref:Transporter n=1 Tax=Ganoderma sinense ZZ0214-1 TaxID=1077348 RepID=A0A2G8SFJ8_9APHY|nr:transporter [Ganoderma sinense ZZ0214-1]
MASYHYVPLATVTFGNAAGIEDPDITVATPDIDAVDLDLTVIDPSPTPLPRLPPTSRPSSRHHRSYLRLLASFFNANAGLLLIALSQGFTSLMGVFVKKLDRLDPPVHPLEVRMDVRRHPVLGPRGIRILLAFRGLSGFVGLFGTYYALQYLSLSDATMLSFLTPMCTAVTGALLLKENLTAKQMVASLFSLLGVVLIARPEFLFGRHQEGGEDGGDDSSDPRIVTPAQRLIAVGVALFGVVGLTSAYTTIRAIGKRAHVMHNLGAFSLFCVLTAPIAMAVVRTPVVIPDSVLSLAMILAVSGCGFAAQMTMTSGLQRETAGRGTLAIYVQIIFSLVFDRVFFNTIPPLLSVIGAAIILSSAIYIAVSKRAPSKPSLQSVSVPKDPSLEEGLLASRSDYPSDEITLDIPPPLPPKFVIGSQESLDGRQLPGSSKSATSSADTDKL